MSSKLPLPLKVPPDVWKWVRAQAAARRMPVGNYVLELLRRGILDEAVDQTVSRLQSAFTEAPGMKELLRQVLVLRYMQEASMGAASRSTLLPEALARADAELAKMRPGAEGGRVD